MSPPLLSVAFCCVCFNWFFVRALNSSISKSRVLDLVDDDGIGRSLIPRSDFQTERNAPYRRTQEEPETPVNESAPERSEDPRRRTPLLPVSRLILAANQSGGFRRSQYLGLRSFRSPLAGSETDNRSCPGERKGSRYPHRPTWSLGVPPSIRIGPT